MKPSLQLKIGQQLTMTPQLQQAIKLLQLSTLDLQQAIQETLETNPMLEINEDGPDPVNNTDPFGNTQNSQDATTPDTGDEKTVSDNWSEDIPESLPVDSTWEDVYQNIPPTSHTGGSSEFSDFESNASTEDSIQNHLLWQLNLTTMTDLDRIIALTIIDSVEPDGYLRSTLESIQETVTQELASDPSPECDEIGLDEIEAVLHRLQHLDPIGVCARNLAECLTVQMNQLPDDTPWLSQAKLIVSNYLPLIGNHDYAQLTRRTKLKESALREVIQIIQALNPKPGELISESHSDYVIPDVTVKKVKGRWLVGLNPDSIPKVRINSGYAAMVKRADTSNDNTYLRSHLQEARWFLKSLQSRNETLLRVASEIVAVQRDFLESGEEAMKPLVLHDIAKAVDMHE